MAPASAQRYSAVHQGEVVTLTDRGTDTVVAVVPSVGNIATAMRVKGHRIVSTKRRSTPTDAGIRST